MISKKKTFEVQPAIGCVILAGGHSRRMGSDKTNLQFGGRSMLQHVAILAQACSSKIAIVGAYRSSPPAWLAHGPPAEWLSDDQPDMGPLAGMLVGLRHFADKFDSALVIGCDYPLFRPALAVRLAEQLVEPDEAVCLYQDQAIQPIPAIYRTGLYKTIARHLAGGQRTLKELFADVRVHQVPTEHVRDLDPGLESLVNINDPQTYQDIVARTSDDA